MDVIVVSQARYGVKNVIQSLLREFAADDDITPTYLTIPTHEALDGVEQVSLLDEARLRRYEGSRLRYLGYAVLNFWRRAYDWLAAHHHEYDVIWFHTPRLYGLVPPELTEKLLVTYHNHLLSSVAAHYEFPASLYYRLFGLIENRGLTTAAGARYTAVNPVAVDEITARGVSRERVRYVENGVDTDRFTPDHDPTDVIETYDLPTDVPLLLFLGRLKEQKRPTLLVDRFADISTAMDGEIALAVAGKGPQGEAARASAAEHDLETVQFLGYVPEEDKPALYCGADYYVLPSSYEGSPLALYEALASGTPAIVSDLPGTRFVAEADCGLVTDFGEAWTETEASKIAEYIRSDENSSANARQYATRRLDWSARAGEYAAEFEAILERQ